MKAREAILIGLLLGIAPTIAGEICSSSDSVISVGPSLGSPGRLPSLRLGPTAPYWVTPPCSLEGDGPCEFDVHLTLEKYDDDGGSPCAFRVDSYIWVTVEVTNASNQHYRSAFSSNGKFWELYLYDRGRANLVARLSANSGYTDDTYYVDLLPGETLTERRLWPILDNRGDPIPAGVYDAYGRFEPWHATEPLFGRDDTTLSPRLTVVLVD